MYRQPPVMTKELLIEATKRANQWVGKRIAQGEVPADIKSRPPMGSWLCAACKLRGPRIAGQAITCQPCMSCDAEEIYGSTATDLMCFKCSVEHELCKRCGADLLLREDRKEWPCSTSN